MFLIHHRAEKGLHILVHDVKNAPEQANRLYQSMILAGIAVIADEVPALKEDSVELMIGFPEDTTLPSPIPDTGASPH